jgi:hypothetical protein
VYACDIMEDREPGCARRNERVPAGRFVEADDQEFGLSVYMVCLTATMQRQTLTLRRFINIHLSPSDLDTTIARKQTIMHLLPPRRFPSARAIIFSQYFRGSRSTNWTSSPYIENDVHLLPRYIVNDVDDLFLWAIIGREQEVQSHVFISPPSSGFARVTGGPRIIPFMTTRPGLIRSIHLGSWTPKVHDPKLVAMAFCTCLAMASYAGGLWGDVRELEEETSPGRTALSVMSGTDDLAVRTCIENVSSSHTVGTKLTSPIQYSTAISTNSNLVLIPLDFQYKLGWEHVSQATNVDNLETAIDAANVFLPLKDPYRDACASVHESDITSHSSSSKIPPIKIKQQQYPTFTLALRSVDGGRLEVRVDADDDGFGPGKSFFLIDIEDL